ncbi:MAG TPA: hypothetical protein VLJ15_04145 [Gammaproteobacteria bacterium]|nr:hypothetical protein [Gammaproteobacteria bacterium]
MHIFGLLRIAGEQAKPFLQGQLTCNMDDITSDTPQLAAHCNPQGRVISLFYLFLRDDHYFLQMPREMIPIAMKALQKYAVFFKVTLTDVSDQNNIEKNFIADNIKKNIPMIYPDTSEKFLPHDLNLPALGAVSFSKGCYTGQEIIARMHYRGKLKNQLYRAKVNTASQPVRGADIYLKGETCGQLVDFFEINNAQYEVLVIARPDDVKTGSITLDSEKKYGLTFL